MGDFLSPAEMASYLQVPAVDTATADLLIGMTEASVRKYCGWNITEETVTDRVVAPSGCHIFLPTRHLTAVANVTDTGTVYTPGATLSWTRGGVLTRTYAGRWSPIFGAVTATWTHGYPSGAPELQIVKQVVAAATGRLMDRTDQLAAVTVGGTSESFAVPPNVPAGLLYNEMQALGAFRVLTVG